MHKNNLFHRDLHDGNILVECNKKIRFYLNDFGLSEKKKNFLDDNYSFIKSIEEEPINNRLNNTSIINMVQELVIYNIIKNNLIVLQ